MAFNNLVNNSYRGVDFGIRFTLEVLGASGAIWGASEVMHLRNSDHELNNTCWRIAAIFVGTIALIRFIYKESHSSKNLNNRVDAATNTPYTKAPSTQV
ncbi:MAG: hypothetical protein KR126chlam3_00852 [Chlamydiae bacterium]|nr:hypothetical protein [Chlamydiota bacterium]